MKNFVLLDIICSTIVVLTVCAIVDSVQKKYSKNSIQRGVVTKNIDGHTYEISLWENKTGYETRIKDLGETGFHLRNPKK